MAACTCGSTEVVAVSGYWAGLPQDAEAKKRHAPPTAPEPRYLYAAGLAALGVAATATGALLGLLAVAGGAGWGAVMRRQAGTAAEKRATWERSQYCRGCDSVFEVKG